MIDLLRPDETRLATKDDLTAVEATLRAEIEGLRTEIERRLADLRVAFTQEINAAFAAQTRTLVIGLLGAVLLIAVTTTVGAVAG